MKTFYVKDFCTRIFKKSLLTAAGLVALNFAIAQTNTFDGSGGTAWNLAENWSLNAIPTSAHDVVIPNGFNVSVATTDAACKSLVINGGATATSVSLTGAVQLTVTEAITLQPGTVAAAHRTLAINAGTVSAASITMTNSGNDLIESRVTLSTGTLTVSGNITMGASAVQNYISSTGAATVNLGGAITGGDLRMNVASIFNYNGSVAQTANANAAYTYGNLYFNNTNAAGVTLGGNLTTAIVAGSIQVQSGILNNGGFSIALNAGSDFIMAANTTFNLTGTSAMPTSGGAGSDITLSPSSLVHFQGGNQTVAALVYGSLSISGTDTKSLAGNAEVHGNFTMIASTFNLADANNEQNEIEVYGNYTHSTGILTETGGGGAQGTFVFAGTTEQLFTNGGTVNNNVNYIVNSGAFVQFATATSIVHGGDFDVLAGATVGVKHASGLVNGGPNGQIQTTNRSFSNTANFIFNGTTNQVTGNALNSAANLTINNPGNTVSLSGNTSLSGSLVITAGTLSAGNNSMTVSGPNWTNNGTFTSGTGTVTFNGGVNQTIGGTSVTTFNNVTLNKTAGIVTLAQDVNINGALVINANLDLASFILTMGAASPAITETGAGDFGTTQMIIASGGGKLRKSATSAAQASYTFPIGDNVSGADYSPVTLTFTGGTYAGYVEVSVTDDKHPNYFNNTDFLTRYWTVSQSGLSGFSAGVNFTYVTADIVGSEANIALGKWDGAEPWVRFPASINTTNNQLFATGITSFSAFTGLSASANLPVKLSSFSGSLIDKSAKLKWNTSEEINSDRYEVEYSSDGRNFGKVGVVDSKNSLTGSSYSFSYSNLSSGKNYFRLKMVDIDARFEYSHVVMLTFSGSLKVMNVYPNPTTSGVTLSFDKAVKGATIQVISMEGRTMSSVSVPAGSTQMQVNMSGMIRGIYNVVYTNDGERSVQRVQKN